MPSITATEPQLVVACDLVNGPHRKRTGVTGIIRGSRLYTPLDRAGNPVRIPGKGLVLSRKLAQVLNVRPGDTIQLRPLIGHRRAVRAPVIGLVDTFFGLSAYAEITYLSRLLGEDWVANVVLAQQYRGARERPVFRALKQRPAVVGVNHRARSMKQLNDLFMESLGTSIFFTVLFAGLLAFGSVLNAAMVSLNERQREVGTLCVLGYTPGQVARIFSGESFLLGLIGVSIGLVAGIGFADLIFQAYDTEMYRFPLIVRPWSLLASAALMLAFVGAAQLVIYRMIRKLQWLDVLNIKE
jgi:putative ABC transport system permease protein